ncbi:WD40-repeat-containing domain protein [Halteromyces radiatus]|uniref:WD40-repeat-containing domain protein n=1 Tax=Halteromyces radiatus TaxID=101107 RepID=UPI00221EC73E|nr:WD40-repeat-containing domain protein [Halteromyces radiatus]KAI8093323.1 WD40-repeat-containing domain protein [Halteromyces radiatus]
MVYQQENGSSFGNSKSATNICSHQLSIPVATINHDVVMTEAIPIQQQQQQQHTMPHHSHRFILGHGGISGSHSMGVKTPTRCMKKQRYHGASSLNRTNASIQASKVAFYVAPPRLQRHRHQQRQQVQQIHSSNRLGYLQNNEPLTNGKKIDFLLELPYELSIHILSYLDIFSLIQLSLVSHGYHSLYRNKDVWRQRVMKQEWQFSLSKLLPSMELDWLHVYKQRYQLDQRWTNGKVNTHYLVGHRDSVYCLQFDNNKIITGSRDRTLKIWDMTTYRCTHTLHGHRASVLCLQFNDKIMVSGSSDKSLIIWDMKTLQPIKVLQGHTAGVLDLAFDDRYIVSCSKDATIRIWDINNGDLLRTIYAHHGPVNAIKLYGDNVVSASGDTLIKMWNVKTGACIREFAGHSRGLACVQYDGKRIISGSNDRTIRVWDAETGKCTMVFEGHTDLVRTLHFNGDRIVSASYDLSVRVWDIRSNACLLNFQSGHTSWIFDVHFDKTKIVSASQDHRVLVMDFSQGLDTQYF